MTAPSRQPTRPQPVPAPWQLTDATDPPGLPPRWRGTPGRWRQHGAPMHGLYQRPAGDEQLADQVDGMAVLNGWRCGRWRGPAGLATWTSPLVSYWNPLLAQGNGRLSAFRWLDHDAYSADALLGGWKPYAYLSCSRGQARDIAARAAAGPLGVAVSRRRWGGIDLARTEPLGLLFPDLGGLLRAYHRVLPEPVFDAEVLPVGAMTDCTPADFVDRFDELEAGPAALLGLVLGYPPLVTAGFLLRPIPGWWAERGSLPPRGWRPELAVAQRVGRAAASPDTPPG